MIEIKENDFDSFFDVPFHAYGSDTLYVSPMRADLKRFLTKEKNPLFRGESDLSYFTASKNGMPLGRITAHAHAEANAKFGTNQAYFGYFDCADDGAIASTLLTKAEDWARRRGFSSIAGNYNLTAMQQIGVMTDGYDKASYTDLVYSPPHIATLLEAHGYSSEFPMATFETPFEEDYVPTLIGPKQQAIIDNPDFTWAPINRKTIAQRMEDARIILNESFAQNPQFLPVTAEEYFFQAKDMKWIMDPRISAMLHYKGRPAACIICVPDLNPLLKKTRSRMGLLFPYHFIRHRMNRKRAVLIYSGVIPEWQGKGVNALVLNRITTNMVAAGYEICGNTWIGASNYASLRQKEKMGSRKLHELSIFRKDLDR